MFNWFKKKEHVFDPDTNVGDAIFRSLRDHPEEWVIRACSAYHAGLKINIFYNGYIYRNSELDMEVDLHIKRLDGLSIYDIMVGNKKCKKMSLLQAINKEL